MENLNINGKEIKRQLVKILRFAHICLIIKQTKNAQLNVCNNVSIAYTPLKNL